MKKITFLFLLITSSLFGQYDFEWARPISDYNSAIRLNAMEVDSKSSLYKAGAFRGDIDLDFSFNVNSIVSNSPTMFDGFLVSYDSLGIFKWSYTTENNVRSIFLKDSFIYAGGSSFLTKLNKETGAVIWEIETELSTNDIAIDDEGYIYSTGFIWSGRDLDPGTGIYLAPDNLFYASKLDSLGNLQWVKLTTSDAIGEKIVIDGNSVTIAGYFENTVDLSFDGSFNFKSSYGNRDLFLTNFSRDNGNQNWVKSFGGDGLDQLEELFVFEGNTFLTMRQNSSFITFESGEKHYGVTASQGSLLKFNNQGQFQFGVNTGNTMASADVDSLGIIYLAASTNENAQTEILKLNSVTGDTISNTPLFDKNENIYIYHLRINPDRDVYIGGEYWTSGYDFDPTEGIFTHPFKGDFVDMFSVKLSQCAPTQSTDTKSICNEEYTWLDGNTYTSDTSGIIFITANSEGCDSVITLELNLHNSPVVNLGEDKSACENENYGVEFDAGSFSSYSWLPNNETSQIISVTNAGEYSVTVTDANGCEAKDTVIFTVYNTPIVDLGSDTAVCENDNNGVEFDAGSFSSYYWTPNGETSQIINATTSGDYIVFVTDANGCENRDTVEFTVYDTPTVDLGEDKSACENENYGVEFDAGSFISYLWLPNNETSQIISVSTPGDYIVNVTDLNGCQSSDTVSFSIDTAPTVNLGNDTTMHIGESLTLDAGTHDSYEWQDASTDQTYEIQASAVGTEYYWVKVTNQSSCSDTDTVAVTIDFNVGVAEFSSSNFELFPNPTTGNLTISAKGNAEIVNTRIYDLTGKEVFFSEGETNINISNLERATYIIKIKTTSGTNFQKLIKK